ncbi:MAG TPA: RNA 2',3'-cyclic phosphodiesterase [Candidatus Acidoferrum sp.]|nr:RNA 2',3'-cyclic phosphodiesterase [Candidatus Acidoferrum sp.]
MRLFVALGIPSSVREHLAAFLSELRNLSSSLGDKRPRWIRPESLHVTLKFIGDTQSDNLKKITAALSEIRSKQSVDLKLSGLGFFPNDRRPRVFWAALIASPNLAELASDIDRALVAVGIPGEIRAFVPHLTLARFEPPGLHQTLRSKILQELHREFGSFQAREFQLMESKLKPSGAEYTSLASFPFTTEP